MSPSLRTLGLAALLLLGRAAAQEAPSAEEVRRAREQLSLDRRDGVEQHLDVLAREGSRASLEFIANFGASTLHQGSTIAAGRALVRVGPEAAADQVRRLLRAERKNPRALVRAAMIAEEIPGELGRTLLETIAKDDREAVAATALRALGARRETASRAQLLSALRSQRTTIASAAAFALSRLPSDRETMEALFRRAQGSGEERVGDACALALARMEGAEEYGDRALALLIPRSSHPSFHGLVKLALSLGRGEDRQLVQRALEAGAPQVREVACDLVGLKKLQGFQRTLLSLATGQQPWRNQVAAWLALRRTGFEGFEDEIARNIAKGGEPSYWAIQCAIRNPDPRLLSALIEAALDTKDPVRRDLAQQALRRLPQSGAELRALFAETAKKQRGTPRAQAALLGLGSLKDAEAFHVLVGLLAEERDPRYQAWICKGLEKLTGHYYEPDPEIWKEWFQVVEGQVAYEPKPIDRKANRERVKKDLELGISKETEDAVQNGLLWLMRHQDADGGWNGSTYIENCVPKGECARDGGIRERPLAYTALACLAFQGAGYSHLDGPYRDVLQRGLEFILSHLDYDGSHNDNTWTFSYEAAIVCQALCDGYALTGDRWLGEGAQRVIDYLVKIQYPGRTWRYRVRSSETDTSVMSWIVQACVSARTAGLDIPEQVFTASEAWLDQASEPVPPGEFEIFVRDHFSKTNTYSVDVSRDKKGKIRDFKIKTWYQPPRLYTPAMTGIGMLLRIWLGWTRAHPFCIGSANQMLSHIPGYDTGLEHEYAFYGYTWYYGSLAMYQMGGRYWQRWREKCIPDLIKNQKVKGCNHGSWEAPRSDLATGLTGGTVYYTAMAILTLETFYRYQPYLARHELRSREDTEVKPLPGERPPEPAPPATSGESGR
jgi:HEAT repeat protein